MSLDCQIWCACLGTPGYTFEENLDVFQWSSDGKTLVHALETHDATVYGHDPEELKHFATSHRLPVKA
jgi:hypothetical protein